MPHFYNHPSTEEFGKIIVTPKQWWRKLKVGDYSIFPYVTMGIIEFTVEVEKIPEPINASHIYTVVERVADNTYRNVGVLDKKKIDIKSRAEYTGDTKFFVGRKDMSPDSVEQRVGITLFSDNVLSINHYVWGGCSVAALLTSLLCILLGWLAGFIQIVPERIIWWPW